MLNIKQFAFGPFGVNTYIVYDADTKDALVIDPGMVNAREQARFDSFIEENKLTVKQIINTHLHLDHCFGDNYVRDRYGVKVAAHVGDRELGLNLGSQAAMFGISGADTTPVEIDVALKEGDIITLGISKIEVMHLPGHSPGGIALYCKDSNFVFVGDTLFRGAAGRTDLPGGNYPALLASINDKLMKLPDSTLVLTGHDMSTTIGQEKATNPYVR